MNAPLLRVRDLTVRFDTGRGPLRAVDGVSFDVNPGTTVALVGESGSGRSVIALSILRLIASPSGSIERGEVSFAGSNLLAMSDRELGAVRGPGISMVFQEPKELLNPVYSVGSQIAEVIRLHQPETRSGARKRAIELLASVGISTPEARADAYPHELSDGMRQRVMLAMALACRPALLIADEPTTALDVSSQAQVLELLKRLQAELGMAILFITHDLGVVAEFASEVVIVYAGRVVESAPVESIFFDPRHPYTRELLASGLNARTPPGGRPRRLHAIAGTAPDLARLGGGCRFAERCSLRQSGVDGNDRCRDAEPAMTELSPGRSVRCHFGSPSA